MDNFEKENKRLKVLIVILLLVLLGFGGFYYYTTYVKVDDKTAIDNKVNDSEVKDNTSNEETNNDNEINENNTIEEENNNWVTYLINAENVKGTLTKHFNDDSGYEPIIKNLNSDELNEYLVNLNKCDIHNIINAGGFDGPIPYNVDISYTANDVEYSFLLTYGDFFFVTGTEKKLVDPKLIELLAKSYPEENSSDFHGSTHVFYFDYKCAFQAIENFF